MNFPDGSHICHGADGIEDISRDIFAAHRKICGSPLYPRLTMGPIGCLKECLQGAAKYGLRLRKYHYFLASGSTIRKELLLVCSLLRDWLRAG